MTVGRCVRRDYGYVGCASDVLGITDQLCSGRRNCTVRVPNSWFDDAAQRARCPEDFKNYLQVSYECLDGQCLHDAYQYCNVAVIIDAQEYLYIAITAAKSHTKLKCHKPTYTIHLVIQKRKERKRKRTQLTKVDVTDTTVVPAYYGHDRRVCYGHDRRKMATHTNQTTTTRQP